MVVGVLKEPAFENRVSLLPEAVSALEKKNITVYVEEGAGDRAFSSDEQYRTAGANLQGRAGVIEASDLLLAIHPPEAALWPALAGKILIGMYQPLYQPEQVQQWAASGCTVFSMDMLPRTSRAQTMDVLSSQANIAGYKAVLLAANTYSRYFPMFMTAAGSIAPAKVLILGAGVAGLQAIATARRLGAVVEVFDTRPAVKEEVMSLGAKFVEVEGAADASAAGGYAVEQSQDFMQRQKEKIAASIAKADIVITTAMIFGKKAPILVTAEMMAAMRRGAVIVDIAAATGGNTEYTRDQETVVKDGITVIGNSALPSAMPADASKLYGKNILNFLALLTTKEGGLVLDFADDLIKGACIVHEKEITNERLKSN